MQVTVNKLIKTFNSLSFSTLRYEYFDRPIVVDYCGDPVRDGENGGTAKLRLDRSLNELVRLVVDPGGRFIHYDDH